MRKSTLVLGLALMLGTGAAIAGVRWLTSPMDLGGRSRSKPTTGTAQTSRPAPSPASTKGSAQPGPIDPNLPLYNGETRPIAAQAIDDTAQTPMNQALVGLARRFRGSAYAAFPLDRQPTERLLLDLQHFDQVRFVEQLLALVNSRQMSTRTEAVDRFSDHVRQLRYNDGQVAYCRRHHYFSRWAQAAERQGYLVNLTPFLPGVHQRRRALTFMSSHPGTFQPMQQSANRDCITILEKSLVVEQAYVPLKGLAPVRPSLRSGDIVALVSQVPGLDISQVGLLEVKGNEISVIHAAAGPGITRSQDLAPYAEAQPGVIGLAFYRPVPNPDGKPDH
jgi:hypothetical protein